MTDPIKAKSHVPALDGVRGLAIALVLFYHFTMGLTPSGFVSKTVIKLGSAGWCGVDLFFVLSGFLITGILDNARLPGTSHPFRDFYGRRILRVFPLYFGTLLALALIGSPRGFEGIAEANLWNWTFTTNVFVAIRGVWFPLSHFWSLAVEEHFYLFWPMIVVLGGRKIALRSAVALIVLGLLSRIALVANGATLSAYVLTICRVDSLAIGGALCLWLRERSEPRECLSHIRWAGLLAGTGLFGLIVWRRGLAFHDPAVQIVGYPLLALASAVLIATMVTTPWGPLLKAFQHPLPRWLGRYSFGLYVFNSIAILSLDGQHAKPALLEATGSVVIADLGYIALAAALTFGAAWLSWHGLEKHALKAKRYLSDERPEKPVTIAPHSSSSISSTRLVDLRV